MASETAERIGPSRLNFVVANGKFEGQRYPLFEGMVIGRGEQAHLYLPDFKASRRHAIVHDTDDGYELEDLSSHNGTLVNGDRMGSRHPMVDGDTIHIGSTRLEVHADSGRGALDQSTENFPDDLDGLVPTIVRRIGLLTPPTLRELPTDEYFKALGLPAPGADLADAPPELFQKILTKTRNFALVYEISKVLASQVGVHELLRTAVDFLMDVVSADRGYIILRDAETGELKTGAARRRTEDVLARRRGEEFEDAPLELSKTIIDWAVRECSAVVSSDASSDQRFHDRQSVLLYNIRSVLCSPMVHGEEVKGIIQLDSLGGTAGFTVDDLELITAIGPVLAVAIENTQLIEKQKETIAEVVEAHGKLVEAQQKLVERERMAIVGRFTSGLAHEVRNLMGPFMLADLLLAEYPDDEHIQECSTLMLEAYTRIGSLVEEIRLLARGERAELEIDEHDMLATIEAVSRFVKCDQETRLHRILIRAEPGLPTMRYDENRIKQVLINLVRNATQAMDRPGDITVRAHSSPDDPDRIHIDVIDTGKGIPPELVGRIFEPFFSTKAQEGTGLGLDVSRRIVERHGGRLICESTVGRGTKMTIELPVGPRTP